ncbi:Anaphase-promoting complex subunit 4 [Chlorella vulgaris]
MPLMLSAALEWRPDGKQLAVGLEDGTLLLLNTEDGEVQHKAQLLPDSALVVINWTEAALASQDSANPAQQPQAMASSQLQGDRARRMFAPPPPPVPPATAGLSVGYTTCGRSGSSTQAWGPQAQQLAVLACASAAGDVVLCTSRLFPLAQLELPSLLGCPRLELLRLATEPSLQQLTVCWRDARADADPHTALHLSVVSTRHVGRHAAQLHRLSAEAAHVGALLEGCQQTFDAASKEWQTAMRECEGSRSRLAALMADYGSSGEPATELQSLLATGAVGGALQQYITSGLGETGLKALARAVDGAVCSAHNLLTDHLQPQLEQLAFRLAELRGLALCLPWRRITGLQPEQVAAAELAALRLVLQAEAVRRQLVAAGAQYRSFFSWLLIVLRRMQEDASDVMVGHPRSQLQAVEQFLLGQYRRDTIGPLLGSTGGTSNRGSSLDGEATPAEAAAAAPAAGGSMLDLVMEVLGRQAPVQAADSTAAVGAAPSDNGAACDSGASRGGGSGSTTGGTSIGGSSLAQMLQVLRAACQAAFSSTSDVAKPTLSLSSTLTLGPAPSALAAAYLPGSATAATAVGWEGQSQMMVLRRARQHTADNAQAVIEAALLQLPSDTRVADLSFYKDGQLALLVAPCSSSTEPDSSPASRLMLVPQQHLHFVQLPGELLAGSDVLRLCQALLEGEGSGGEAGGLPLPADCRQRALPYSAVQAPLAASASRGVACVLAGLQRVLLYDLEEDDEQEAEEEEEEEQADKDAAGALQSDDDAAFQSPPRQ